MSALLVSVRDPEEAGQAVAGGAGVVDLKEPRRGSLGRADPDVWRRVVAGVGDQVPISVALGELVNYRPPSTLDDWAGIRFAKWGLSGCRRLRDWPRRWEAAIESLPARVLSVSVIYADADVADSPIGSEVILQGARLGCKGILFDTFRKRNATLFDVMPVKELAALIESARTAGMAVALAGSLGVRHLETALRLAPDLIAVRSAACRGGRTGRVDQEKVRRLAQIISGPRAVPCCSVSNLYGGSQNT